MSNHLRVATVLFSLVGLPLAASAGTIRHDRADSNYLNLGAGYANVGQVYGQSASQAWYGSATAIGSRWAITAAHVVEGATGLSVKFGSQTYAADGYVAHSGWTGNLLAGTDLALVRFAQDLPVTAATRHTSTSLLGKTATAVGYGMTGTGQTGAVTFDQKKRGVQNVLDNYGSALGGSNNLVLYDFDRNKQGMFENFTGSRNPLTNEGMAAPGDSGGGLFVDGKLAGVTSFILANGLTDRNPNADYGDAAGYTLLAPFASWINDVLAGRIALTGTSSTTLSGAAAAELRQAVLVVPEPASIALASIAGVLILRRPRA